MACVYGNWSDTQNAVDDVKLILVGNKLDLEQHRQVTTHKGEKVSS